MLKISKKIRILFVLLIFFLFVNTIVLATDINMNLPTDDNYVTYENGTYTNNIDDNTGNNVGNTNTNNNSITDASQVRDDVGGTTTASNVSSIAQENMSFSNILNILLITVGVVLILLAIAILIRLKS